MNLKCAVCLYTKADPSKENEVSQAKDALTIQSGYAVCFEHHILFETRRLAEILTALNILKDGI